MARPLLLGINTVQPPGPGPAPINWASPFSRNLVSAILPTAKGMYDCAARQMLTIVNAPTTEGTVSGRAAKFASASSMNFSLPIYWGGASFLTFAAVFKINTSTASQGFVGIGNPLSGSKRVFILQSASGSTLDWGDQSGTTMSSTKTFTAGQIMVVIGTVGQASGDMRLSINGTVKTGTGTLTATAAPRTLYIGCRYSGGTTGFSNSSILGAFAWTRRFAVPEHGSFWANPWQVFAPQVPRFFFNSASVAANEELRLLTMGVGA